MKFLISGYTSFVSKAMAKKADTVEIPKELYEHPDLLTDFVFENDCDGIVYLSAYGNHYAQKDLSLVKKVNIDNPLLLAECSYVNPFVYFSSSSVGMNHQTAYSLSKYIVEEEIKEYEDCIIIRPSSITGVGDHTHHLIPTLIRSCLYGEKMLFVSDATHDFIDSSDVADATMLLVKKRAEGIYNVSTNCSWTNEQVKNIVEELTGRKANIEAVKSLRSYDCGDWKVDNSKLLDLGWQPKVSLTESIKAMIEAQKERGFAI